MSNSGILLKIVAANRAGEGRGIASWCTAQADTLRAILAAHRGTDDVILIEATCNQVNQFGGYTGMTPAAFRAFVEGLAADAGIDRRRLILGGDHLGPNPWKGEPSAAAMRKATGMVAAYVQAGFTKIHLDASMACADDAVLPDETIAERAAMLCAAAEGARGATPLSYVIGTEVPIPGGETEAIGTLAVTRAEQPALVHDMHARAFARHGLAEAFERVIAIVVQPGVDFSNDHVLAFRPGAATELSAAVLRCPGLVFEAHSTDYQSAEALRGLVQGHFAILKVGPELTFAFREAVFAMAAIETWLRPATPSNLLATVTAAMDAEPKYWRPYVTAGPDAGLERAFGLSDRIRYYWQAPQVSAALQRLFGNIDARPVPATLAAQYAGQVGEGDAPLSRRIIAAKIGAVVARYRAACGSTI